MRERTHRRVLVTGATGFVGKALVPALVAAGYDVRATTRAITRGAGTAHVEWVQCDVNRGAELGRALDDVDPDTVSGRQILSTIAPLRGRRVPSVPVPFLSVSLSSWWLKLVTGADFSLARELVLGFKGDLLPHDDRYWSEIHYAPQWSFEASAQKALADEPIAASARGAAARLAEAVVQRVSPKLPR